MRIFLCFITFILQKIERMSANSREEELTTSVDLKFTMEAMTKQFECFGNLFQ